MRLMGLGSAMYLSHFGYLVRHSKEWSLERPIDCTTYFVLTDKQFTPHVLR
jgi:hypothetical protein